jgi:hypothetical protein
MGLQTITEENVDSIQFFFPRAGLQHCEVGLQVSTQLYLPPLRKLRRKQSVAFLIDYWNVTDLCSMEIISWL